MDKDYFLGIDIGTNSIGFAVTDINYNLIKKGSKSFWGVRLFEEVSTANERRNYRSNRRRLQRKKQRIEFLQSIFKNEIYKIDDSFFERLEESKYKKEDRISKKGYKYLLFNDKNFNDKDYYKRERMETISHLKKALIESDEKFDIRLIYLAIHNIIKNRGHFLFENISGKKVNFKQVFNELIIHLNNKFDEFDLGNNNYDELEQIIKEDIKPTEKEKKLLNLFSINKKTDEQKYLLLLALSNGKFDLCKFFKDETLKDENDKNITIKISEIDDDKLNTLPLDDENKNILILLKAIYDWSLLENILKNNEYISFARVEIYNQHKKDLKILKKFIKDNFDNKTYEEMFKGNSKNGYANYIGLNKVKNKKVYIKKCIQEDFYKYINSLLNKAKNKESEEYLYISEKLSKNKFLPKQVNKDNCVIPYQINLIELKKILQNASKHYPFLLEKDKENDNITNIDKIISIFTFKVPYYVGPLNNNSHFSWLKRSNEKIYPWNFNKVVDIEETSEKFIRKMTNKCTYLKDEDVLAKNSLLYSEFMVLNEINNIKINNVKISSKIKKRIFEELFLCYKKVTLKKLKEFLILNGYMEKTDTLSGIDIDIKSSMSSYIDFKKIINKYNDKNMVDNIINYIVIFGNDKKILKSKIEKSYGNILLDEEIKLCCKFNYSGWGRLSKKLLTEITDVNKETGEILNIIDMLKETNYNFMELLSNNFTFNDKIKDLNNKNKKYDETLLQIVNNLYISPKVKRPVYQALLIIKEIEKIMKCPPKKIFMEVAREKVENKNRTKKRKDKLLELYKNTKKEFPEIYNQLEKTDYKEFDKIKVYLYFLQLGKCMYTERPIPFESLGNTDIYDRDHIYPQSKIKDDSFDNLVLVSKKVNLRKDNIYPINNDIQQARLDFWDLLKSKGLLTEEKYKRLTRKTPLTEDELNVFIQRQLVETRQASKCIGNIIGDLYPETKLVYVKAKLISNFRQREDLLKCREVNDYHHAKDAYLNIVVGNVYYTKFTSKYYVQNLITGNESLKNIFSENIKNVWDKEKSKNIVKNTMYKNNILFTRYSDTKRGKLFDQTLYPVGKSSSLFPLKKGLDVEKYGGYDKKSVAYFNVVEHTKNKKRVKSIEFIYMYNKADYEKNQEKYCKDVLNLVEPKILIKKIKINTLFSLDGLYVHLSGKTDDSLLFKNAMQLILSYEEEKYIKKIYNCVQKGEQYFKDNAKYIDEELKINRQENSNLYNVLLNKILNSKYNIVFSSAYDNLNNGKKYFENSLSLYEQCKILLEVIKMLHCNPEVCNIKLLNLGKNTTGSIKISKNTILTKYKNVKIIYQSITGIYEQEIDLLGNDFIPKKRR